MPVVVMVLSILSTKRVVQVILPNSTTDPQTGLAEPIRYVNLLSKTLFL
jgi:hypothetical protein